MTIEPNDPANDAVDDDAISADAVHLPAAAEPADDPLAALLGGGGPGGFDFGQLMETAGQMQAQLLAAQEQAASTVVEGVAGGGAVRVAVTGGFEFQSVTISPDAVDPNDVEMLQDLILAALRDAVDEIQGLQQPPDLGGLDLGGLLGGG
ncbi:MAG TPA: YbaB/EbfC family nucleoid-associated protein [Acidimicrobiales bacterium]|nr:YbaB/EbfC family nucleoid-associated protein [Acidimicrobiales bacterium]